MKRIVTLFALILSFSASADIKFFQGTWDEALQKAKETQKPIFVDFYATWCRPCKYMSKKVFTDSEVSDFYNKNFIPFKVDAEKEEQALVESVNLKAYPTLGYFNPKGELILAWTGVLETDEMLQKGKQVIQFEQNKSAVEKNPNNIQALTDYLEILRFTDFPKAEKLAKNYLKEVKKSNLDKEENWFFIRYFTADYNTREFKYIAENPKAFIDYDEEFGEYYKSGIKSLMLDAIQQKDYSKIELHKKYHISVYKALKLLKLP